MPSSNKGRALAYVLIAVVAALGTVGIMLLWQNIGERKREARESGFKLTTLTEESVDHGVPPLLVLNPVERKREA